MSTKSPADPSMDRSATPVRPAGAPASRKPAPPPQPPRKSGGAQRFMLQFLLLAVALAGAFGTGYLVNENEMQLDRTELLQQQLDAERQVRALEQQVAELQSRREIGNQVQLDLTEVFEPIREAVGRIALVRMGEISREITTELTRLVEDDAPNLERPADATGAVRPDGMNDTGADQAPASEAASATDEDAAPAPSAAGGPDGLQPSNTADAAGTVNRPDAAEVVEESPATDLGLTRPAEDPEAEKVSRAGSGSAPADWPGSTTGSARPESAEGVERLAAPRPRGSPVDV